MKVIIMRHGEAGSFSSAHGIFEDSQRILTNHGIAQAHESAEKIKATLKVARVIASPYARASQTGKIVAEVNNAPFEEDALLSPLKFRENLIEPMLDGLEGIEPDQAVVLVSHIPLVTILVESLTKTNEYFHFSTASFVIIDYETRTIVGTSHNP